ncbi:MAG TPA: carbohydrate ABC transporter permease [Chloroflexota bacterium]|jgi:ABC-type glycerol-3-phosphate transport system permease component
MAGTEGTLAHGVPTARTALWNRKSVRQRVRIWGGAIILTLGSIVMMLPLAWMLSTSVKDEGEVFIVPIRWIPSQIFLSNYPEAVVFIPYWRFFINSVEVALLTVAGAVITASLVAYAFARLRAPGRDVLFLVLLSTMMLPGEVTLVPTYLIFRAFGTLDTYYPLIVPSWLGGSPFYIFLLRQFFLTLPLEMDEAAKIDGAGFLDIFRRIILPLAKPALATVAIFAFFNHWNAFQTPLIYLNTMESYTVPVGLRFYLSTMGNAHWNYLMAATLIAIIPPIVIFFAAQRYFVQGAVLTGLKA